MNESTAKLKAKAAAAPVVPLFELPKFEMPKMEVPAAFREAAEKSVAHAKDTYTTAMKGSVDYNLKLIDAARANANATFDFVSELIGVKSLSEVVELSTAHARKQFEAFTQQAKDLTAAAQKLATDTSEPLKTGVSKAFKKVA